MNDDLSGLIDEMSPEEKVLVLEYFTRDREEFLYAASEARKRYERARKAPAARPGECGAVSPRDKSQWCREPEGHTCDHSPVASPPSVCGVLLNPPDLYTYCRLPAGHDWAVECTLNIEEQP